jgi:hypothetical protein
LTIGNSPFTIGNSPQLLGIHYSVSILDPAAFKGEGRGGEVALNSSAATGRELVPGTG